MSTYSYDETAYTSTSFPQTHPHKLATIATLFGMKPAFLDRCNVLELGCGNGANILPMAEANPQSTFRGIDLSALQIEDGKKAVQASGLTNVRLEHQDILEFDPQGELYDYIIVHGVFSWVTDQVRQKILKICQDSLSPRGIAYISYNALPGWHMRGMLRDMMTYHVAQFDDEKQKIDQARALLKFLSDAVPAENNAYGIFLQEELKSMFKWSDSYLRHEFLEKENRAFHFHEFISLAQGYDLQYLGEPELSAIIPANFSMEVQKTLHKIGRNVVAMEQYMDFLRNRTFRMSLLVRSSHELNRGIQPSQLRNFWFSTAARLVKNEVDLAAGVKEEFSVNGRSIYSDNTLVKATLVALSRAAPQQLNFTELLTQVRSLLTGNNNIIRDHSVQQHEEVAMCDQLLLLYSRGLVEALVQPYAHLTTSITDKPEISAVARYQALNTSGPVTNLKHTPIEADGFVRQVMSLLDGAHTRDQIVSILAERVQAGVFAVTNEGKTVTEASELESILKPRVDVVVESLGPAAFYRAS